MSHPDPTAQQAVDLARQAAAALGTAFDDEGPYSAEMTAAARTALGSCVMYLRVCLGPAQSAAIPDLNALADTILALHAACGQLRAGLPGTLTAIDRRRQPADKSELGIEDTAAMRAALASACDALLTAARSFADAHHAATTRH